MIDGDVVSVVVPVYNVEKYLDRCLDSIVNQSYERIEIILVNDGSTDSSLDICKSYKNKDLRIKIINQKNGGLSCARNSGLQKATGKYIVFVDSDDYVSFDYVNILYRSIVRYGSDIAVCGYSDIYADEKEPRNYIKKLNKTSYIEMSGVEAMADFFSFDSLGGVMAWNKMYKTSIFKNNKIIFPVGKIHEDNFTTYKLYYHSSSVIYIDKPLYYYQKRFDSIMGRGFSVKSLDIINAADESISFVGKNAESIIDKALTYRINVIISVMNLMVDSRHVDKILWLSLRSSLFSTRSCMGIRVKPSRCVYIIAARFGYKTYTLLRKSIVAIKSWRNAAC